MQRHTKIATILFAVFLVTAAGTAAIGDKRHVDQATSIDDHPDFTDVQVSEASWTLFDSLFSSLSGPNTAAPGQQITMDFTIDTEFSDEGVSDNVGLDDVLLIVEVYDCADGSCNSDGDEHVDTVRVWLDEKFDNFAIYSGQEYEGQVTYTVPSDANGAWAAAAYFWVPRFQDDGYDNDGDGTVDEADDSYISADKAIYQFSVEGDDDGEFDDGSGGSTDGSSDSSDGTSTSEPDVVTYRQPDVSVNNGQVESTVYLENHGSTMDSWNIVEMQVRPAGSGPLSALNQQLSALSGQQVCDPQHPENVHVEYKLDAGDSKQVTLRTSAIDPNQRYTVYLLTRTGCSQDRQGAGRVSPYPYSENAGTYCVGTCETSNSGGIPTTYLLGGVVLLFAVGYVVRS